MNAYWLEAGMGKIAIASIDGYQKYISPRKGFSCAHRHLHGGESCSQYIKQLVAEKGLLAAIRTSRQRFAACREANQTLRDLGIASISSRGDSRIAPTLRAHKTISVSLKALASSSPPDESPPDESPPDNSPDESPPDNSPDESPPDSRLPKKPLPNIPPPRGKKPAKQQDNSNCDTACAEAACEAPFYCQPEDCNFWEAADCSPDIDCAGADCAGADCAGADCSGADCSGADCGSCF